MPAGISWPPATPTQYAAAASTFPGICQKAESILLEQLHTTIAQHWSVVGTCSNLFNNSHPSTHTALMDLLETLSVSFVSHEKALLDCITVVRDAQIVQERLAMFTSPSGKTP